MPEPLHLRAGQQAESDPQATVERLRLFMARGIEPSRTTQGAECFITAHALDAVWVGLAIGLRGSSVAAKNVAWQEVLASLHRRRCLMKDQYETLVQSPLLRFTE